MMSMDFINDLFKLAAWDRCCD